MLQRYQRGEDLSPFVNWIKARPGPLLGKGGRVLTQFSWLNDPLQPVPAAMLAEFAKWMLGQGLFVELTLGADCSTYEPAREGRTGFGQSLAWLINRTADVLGHVSNMPNVEVELCNEPGKNLPGDCSDIWQVVTALGLQDPKNRPVLMTTGAYDIIGHESMFDALDIVSNHGPRKPDWPGESGKTGHFVIDGWAGAPGWKGFAGRHVYVDEDEPIGASETPDFWRRDIDPRNFGDGAAGTGLSGGGTFHCNSGIEAVVPGPNQTACADAWFTGLNFFPPDAPLGQYSHDSFPDFPLVSIGNRPDLASEVAGRVFADRAYVVAAQATQAWRDQYRQTRLGYRIVREGGPVGNWLELAR